MIFARVLAAGVWKKVFWFFFSKKNMLPFDLAVTTARGKAIAFPSAWPRLRPTRADRMYILQINYRFQNVTAEEWARRTHAPVPGLALAAE